MKDNFKNNYAFVCFTFFTILFIFPVFTVLTQIKLKDFIYVFSNKYYLKVMFFSLRQALYSAILSVVVGLPGAWIIKNCSFKAKKLVKSIYNISYVLPSIIVVLSFVAFYGNSGLLASIFGKKPNILYSFKAVLMAHVFYNFPVAINVISSYWAGLDQDLENFARSTGLSKVQTFFSVTLPRLVPSIASSLSLIFLLCFTSFAIILVLGGSPTLTTAELEIYRQAKINLNISRASCLVVYSIAVSSLVLIIHSYLEKKTIKETQITNTKPFAKPKFFSVCYLIVSCAFILLPVLSIFFKALSFKNLKLLSSCLPSIINTLIIALFSSILGTLTALGMAGFLSKKRISLLSLIPMLSLSVSSVIIGLSYFILSKKLSFIPSFLLLILCHSIICTPFCFKTLISGYKNIPVSYNETAISLGARQKSIFKTIELRALKNEIVTSLTFGFAISCGELNASMIIGGANLPTVPVQIYRLIASYNYSGACALGLVLTLICLCVNLIKLKVLDI